MVGIQDNDTIQVCLNGHQITAYFYRKPEQRRERCEICGSYTIFKCPECNKDIPSKSVLSKEEQQVPEYCQFCGKAFPWEGKNQNNSHKFENPIDKISNICGRFHLIAEQLKNRRESRNTLSITDEYDVQDLMHSLLWLYFDDIRPEEPTPSHGGRSSRVDFLLKQEKIVIETKKTRHSLGDKELGEQLIIDIARYKSHPDCKILYCFVYDPEGRIKNKKSIENDLSGDNDSISVIVKIIPAGT